MCDQSDLAVSTCMHIRAQLRSDLFQFSGSFASCLMTIEIVQRCVCACDDQNFQN